MTFGATAPQRVEGTPELRDAPPTPGPDTTGPLSNSRFILFGPCCISLAPADVPLMFQFVSLATLYLALHF